MKTDDIKILLEKFYLGETSEDEELTLREFLLKDNSDPEFEDDRNLFAMFEDAGSNMVDFDFIPPEKKAGTPLVSMQQMPWYFGIAAAVSFLVTGVAIGWLLGTKDNVVELSALRQDISEIKAMTTVNRLNAESASDRILAAYEAGSSDNTSTETISALINAMSLDENVNVRIAAADALFRFGDHVVVRNAFVQALRIEKDPNLQIRLINMLVNLQEKEALPRLKELMESQEHIEVVRQTAAQGISHLL